MGFPRQKSPYSHQQLPIFSSRQLDALYWLVRVQCHVSGNPNWSYRTRGDQFSHGDGRRNFVALIISKNDPGFIHNGALAGLVAICAGSDKVHPIGAFIIGGLAGVIFVKGFTWEQEKLKIDDVLGAWPLHGLAGTWGGIACGIFGQEALGGIGGVSFVGQIVGSVIAIIIAVGFGYAVYKILDASFGIRLSQEEEQKGSDLTIHNLESYPEDATSRF